MTNEHDADVLILGGSFTGIELVRQLHDNRRGRALEIIVVDRQREHFYIPLGHELLSQRLALGSDERTVLPSDEFVHARPRARWVRGEIVGFDPSTHTVSLADGQRLSARFVVVALGSDVRPPAKIPGAERMLAYKSQTQFEQARAVLEQRLGGGASGGASEGAERPTIVVAGGNISGVEIAGELAHLAKQRPAHWCAPKVVLVHAGARLLPGLTARAGRKAAAALQAQGVELHLETCLVGVDEGHAIVRGPKGERTIPCDLSFWAAGLQPPPVIEGLNLPLTDDRWLRVGPTLQCFAGSADDPEIFAGGDIARVYGGTGRWPTMQRAIESIFAARTLALNILTLSRESPGYAAKGVPPLQPHTLWSDFAHGVSIGGESLVVYGRLVVGFARINIWFRRFLMRMYMRRYRA